MEPFDYAAFYCEENIHRLCARREFRSKDAVVAIVSNAERRVLMRSQRAGAPPDGSLFWDYHVIGLRRTAARFSVWDFESRLGLVSPADEYLRASFVDSPEGRPLFRILDAEIYVRELRSDRSHMRLGDGSWRAPPPVWPASDAPGGVLLRALVDMGIPSPGEILTLEECRRRYAAP